MEAPPSYEEALSSPAHQSTDGQRCGHPLYSHSIVGLLSLNFVPFLQQRPGA